MDVIREWIRANAESPEEALRPLVADTAVVALGASTRQAHEISLVQQRILRYLVTECGFRALSMEGDEAASSLLDDYLRTGHSDAETILRAARPFLRTKEILDVVHWLRAFNIEHPHDQVQITNSVEPRDSIEQGLAENVIDWFERTGQRIVYWGGMAHTVNGNPRTVHCPPDTLAQRSAGSYLREQFGSGYVSIGLMFQHGHLPFPVPAPIARFSEAPLDIGERPYLLNLRAEQPEQVRRWLHAPATTRLIGPRYLAAEDPAFQLTGGTLAEWFDAIVHITEVTPVEVL